MASRLILPAGRLRSRPAQSTAPVDADDGGEASNAHRDDTQSDYSGKNLETRGAPNAESERELNGIALARMRAYCAVLRGGVAG
jgi:hypothetical protein